MFSSTALKRVVTRQRQPMGFDYAKSTFYNKGTAFSIPERRHLKIEGTLPSAVESLEDQIDRCWSKFQLFKEPINKYQYLRGIMDNNSTLYYAVVTQYMKECLPIIYTPTVGEACQRYGDLYSDDKGLYLAVQDLGNIRQLVKNIDKARVSVLVVTDGSRILGLGDLGANGMGISIGKSSLYVAAGGVDPRRVLPVILDVGTNNVELRNNPLYLGVRKPRCNDENFYAVLDEFMAAAKEEWPTAVIQFEDFSNNHCFDMLERYQNKYRCFNDDIQGTGAVIAAGFHNAIKLSGMPLEEHRILIFGAGSAAAGVAESICALSARMTGKTAEEIKNHFYFVDSKGLVTDNRGDVLAKHKIPWARSDIAAEDNERLQEFEDVVEYVKPTALIGLGATGGVFTRDIVESIMKNCDRPIIFPLSNPTSKAEIIPANAYRWTNGKAIVASGSPFPTTSIGDQTCRPSQGNNLYVFPGIGLGCAIAQPSHIPQEALIAASECLARLTTEDDHADGQLYPPIDSVRRVSLHIAVAVIKSLQELGLAKADLPDNMPDLKKLVREAMWSPVYRPESYYLTRNIANADSKKQSG